MVFLLSTVVNIIRPATALIMTIVIIVEAARMYVILTPVLRISVILTPVTRISAMLTPVTRIAVIMLMYAIRVAIMPVELAVQEAHQPLQSLEAPEAKEAAAAEERFS
jgi:hypothetical protein